MIKKLQNTFTTLEQSERLLQLGVPAESADCYYDKCAEAYDRYNICEDGHFDEHYQSFEQLIPCWSVGRLIEILRVCVTDIDVVATLDSIIGTSTNMTFSCVTSIEMVVFNKIIDFSKLEE